MSLSAGAMTILRTKLKTINGQNWNDHQIALSTELFARLNVKAKEVGLLLETCDDHHRATLQHVGNNGPVTNIIERALLTDIEEVLPRIQLTEAKDGKPERYDFEEREVEE